MKLLTAGLLSLLILTSCELDDKPSANSVPVCDQEKAAEPYDNAFPEWYMDNIQRDLDKRLLPLFNCLVEQERVSTDKSRSGEPQAKAGRVRVKANGTVEFMFVYLGNASANDYTLLAHELIHVMQRDCYNRGILIEGQDVLTWIDNQEYDKIEGYNYSEDIPEEWHAEGVARELHPSAELDEANIGKARPALTENTQTFLNACRTPTE